MELGQTPGQIASQAGMRILLDGGPLTVATGGIRRYVQELSVALATQNADDDIHVVTDRPIERLERLRDSGIRIHAETPEGWDRRWWLVGLPRLCRRLNATVFHGTDFTVPLLHRFPTVITIHDLSPWMNADWQPAANRIRRRMPWMLRLGLADQVITVSEAVRGELLARFRFPAQRVHAIPLAADDRFRPVAAQPSATPYFLYVGTLEPRKNIPALLNAWRSIFVETGIPLKIAGRRREDYVLPLEEPGLTYLGTMPDEALPALYSGAVAVIYPSEYEGFGLPVLEAMQCGVPVIVGRAAALCELVADDGIVVETGQGDSLRTAMQRFAGEPAYRQEWSARSLRRATEFSWQATARKTREVYREAVRRFEHAS